MVLVGSLDERKYIVHECCHLKIFAKRIGDEKVIKVFGERLEKKLTRFKVVSVFVLRENFILTSVLIMLN